MRFIAKSPSARPARPARAARVFVYPANCPDLALVYGKGCGLSPFRRVFWGFLAPCPGYQEIGPPRPGQGLGFGPAPGCDPGMVARQQDFRDGLAFELLRAGILRAFQ